MGILREGDMRWGLELFLMVVLVGSDGVIMGNGSIYVIVCCGIVDA